MSDITKDFSIEEAIRFGWETMKENIGFFIGVTVILFLITGALAFLEEATKESSAPIHVLIMVVSYIISWLVGFGYNTIIPLKFIDNKQPDINDLFGGFAYFSNVILATLVFTLAVVGGMLLFVIPGIYAAIIFFFFSFFIYDNDLKPMESLKASMKLTEGVRMKILGYFFAIAGVNIVGILACGIGIFVSIPISVMATAYVYRTLRSQTPDEDTPSAKPEADLKTGGSIDP